MSEGFRQFLTILKAIGIYIGIGAILSFVFYSLKKRELFGGYIGGLVVGVIGALVGGFVLDRLFYDMTVMVLEFLARDIGVNVIAGFIGGYAALYIMNKLNHDKTRTKF